MPHVRACELTMLTIPEALCCSVDQLDRQGRRG